MLIKAKELIKGLVMEKLSACWYLAIVGVLKAAVAAVVSTAKYPLLILMAQEGWLKQWCSVW